MAQQHPTIVKSTGCATGLIVVDGFQRTIVNADRHLLEPSSDCCCDLLEAVADLVEDIFDSHRSVIQRARKLLVQEVDCSYDVIDDPGFVLVGQLELNKLLVGEVHELQSSKLTLQVSLDSLSTELIERQGPGTSRSFPPATRHHISSSNCQFPLFGRNGETSAPIHTE
jgi:hypothetical protein